MTEEQQKTAESKQTVLTLGSPLLGLNSRGKSVHALLQDVMGVQTDWARGYPKEYWAIPKRGAEKAWQNR